jgi:four helix bundle protein
MLEPHLPPSRVIKGYRDLLVWRRAMDLVTATYRLTASLPRDEKYGLVQQLHRAAVSIPSNVAEGHGRDHLGDYLHHLSVANGSLMELETQVMITRRLGYVSREAEERMLTATGEVGRMLSGLARALRKRRDGTRRQLTPDT